MGSDSDWPVMEAAAAACAEFGVAYALPAVGDEVSLKIEAEFKAAS